MFQNQSKRNLSFVKELILFHHLANIPLEPVAVSGEIEDPSLGLGQGCTTLIQ